ncbi:SGNH/GDSL hydrolase family protein [Pedobacter sp. HDW13]|uniref:SGNH/GDSL hydrolase family protein n=1 Tax=unclassified Pedobacter TaxID=2628915 RepID=UPI000F5AD23E|nr:MULTISPECIES: SGNH/GDSL hydrolase family protein [unclassified Pedobacter]QIL39930.1 SGNH/GDSL hydrolase family protein [Pedobacter sp. HDW13]RQO65394.1 G-D-S-L family lipolytic protein [Pedobacter sp. KBW01]
MKTLFRTTVLLSICLIALTSMTFKPKRIIFFGDSITQQGVSKNGYVTLIKKSLDSTKYDIIGAGIGGNKVYDLYLRLEDDVLNKKPDLVVIYVGINDVWHKQSSHTGTDYDKYLKFYQALINKIQGVGSKVVLVTPSVVGEKKDGTNELDADLNKYAAGIRALAAKNNLPVCDLRKVFADYEVQNNPEDKEKGILTVDRVHLNETGNKLVADQLLPLVK